ncbi:hypothetical protein [Dactylosporangium sp. NPDC048998]|uniref:hypothetical protein n=1 Tax=Dactylosporangium sp. NPDC048998 TaxID=3363976 RepID=UPI00372448D7
MDEAIANVTVTQSEESLVESQSPEFHLVLATLGFVSLGLLWLGVVTGFLLHGSWRPPFLSALHAIHRATAGLGLSLGAVHGIGQLALPGGSITMTELVVPFTDSDNRIGTGVAVVGSEVLAAVGLSVIIQRRLGPARWRALHLFSYAAFMLIVAHVLISGTDVTPVWVWLPILGGWLVTVALWLATVSRLSKPRPGPSPRIWSVAESLPERGDSPDVSVSITLAGRPALQSAAPPEIDVPRHGDIGAVPGVRRRPPTSRGDR